MKYLAELKALNLPRNKFAIFASGPMAIRNLRENQDIDVIVKEPLWKELSKKHNIILKNNGKTKCIEIRNIEIFNDWKPWFDDINELIDTADIIQNIRFVKLTYVLEWKKAMNREKDIRDIKIIEDYMQGHSTV